MHPTTEPGRTRLGRYVDLEPLGQGAMGTVFRGRDPELDRVVAIKLLIDSSPSFVARFRREAQAVAKLVHPNVVQVFDFGVDEGGRPYFVMELLDGRPLDRLLREEGRLDAATVLTYGEQAADALGAAHRAGIVHRDIKPGNLVLDRQGTIKVVDFGIARVADDGATGGALTGTATLLGTPGYMAPEQAQGKPVDGRADVYSLGVTLYELLSGDPPFPGSDPISIVVKSLEQPLPDLRRSGKGVPEELAVLVEKMTTKDPAQRLPSMTAVKNAMREASRRPRFAAGSLPSPEPAVSGIGATVAALPATEVTPPVQPRRSVWIPLLFLGAAAVSAAVVWLFLLRSPRVVAPPPAVAATPAPADAAPPAPKASAPSGPLRVAVLKFKNLSGDAALDMLERGIPETAVSTLAGQIPEITLLERNDLESNITEIDRGGDLHFDPETVAKLGKLEGIEYAVLGGIQAAKDQIRITARVVRVVNGEVLYTILHTGSGSVFDAQDAVAKLVDEKLRLLAAKEGR